MMDVDKLFTYQYNTFYKDEKLRIFKESRANNTSKSREKALQNQYIDLHWSILSNPQLTDKILAPLDLPDFENAANLIPNNNKTAYPDSIISSFINEKSFIENRSSKTGVAAESLTATFNAITQGKDISLMRKVNNEGVEELQPFKIKAQIRNKQGNIEVIELSKFSSSTGLKGLGNTLQREYNQLEDGSLEEIDSVERTKSSNINNTQSIAVDNAKSGNMGKGNMNDYTMPTLNTLMRLEADKSSNNILPMNSLVWFITQDSIKEYVKRVQTLNDTTVEEFSPNKKQELIVSLLDEYMDKAGMSSERDYSFDENYIIPVEYTGDLSNPGLYDLFNANIDPKLKAYHQLNILKTFILLDELGGLDRDIMTALNSDTKGVGKSLIYSALKEENYNSVIGNAEKFTKPNISNNPVLSIDGINKVANPSTQVGKATENSVVLANTIYSEFYPYNSIGIKRLLTLYAMFTGKQKASQVDEKTQRNLLNEFKSFIFNSKLSSLFDRPILEERQRLLRTNYSEVFPVVKIAEVDKLGEESKVRISTKKDLANGIYQINGDHYELTKISTVLLNKNGSLKINRVGGTEVTISDSATKDKLAISEGYKSFEDWRKSTWKNNEYFFYKQEPKHLYNFKRVDVNVSSYSLAKRTQMMKQKYPDNYFLKRLLPEIAIDQSKQFDLVKYSASITQRVDDIENTRAFTELLTNDETKEFAIDLIKYAYITGGNQNAISFLRYIPAQALMNNEFSKGLRDTINYLEEGNLFEVNYINFLKQYFQHNPYKAMKLDETELLNPTGNKEFKVKIPDTFTMSKEDSTAYLNKIKSSTLNMARGESNEDAEGMTAHEQNMLQLFSPNTPPKFVYLYDTDSRTPVLFEGVETENQFVFTRIPLLGTNKLGSTEYDGNTNNAKSLLDVEETVNSLKNKTFVKEEVKRKEKEEDIFGDTYDFKRYGGYEVSTKGDKRFSAFVSKIKAGTEIYAPKFGKTIKLTKDTDIETLYQVLIKGYNTKEEGKGKQPLTDIKREVQKQMFLDLWRTFAEQNPALIEDLRKKVAEKNNVLSDMFSTSDINQAWALSRVLNEKSNYLTNETVDKKTNSLFSNVTEELSNDNLIKTIKEIAKGNSSNAELAKILLTNENVRTGKIRFLTQEEEKTADYAARTYPATKEIWLSKSIFSENEQLTLLHELLHLVASSDVNSYLINKDNFTKQNVRKSEIIESLDNLRLSIIKALEAGRTLTLKNGTVLSLQGKQEFDKKLSSNNSDYDSYDLGFYYGLTNTKEFISVLMTDPIMKEALTLIKVTQNKTFWEKVKELFNRYVLLLTKEMNTNIDRTALSDSISNVLELITFKENVAQNQNKEVIEEKVQTVATPEIVNVSENIQKKSITINGLNIETSVFKNGKKIYIDLNKDQQKALQVFADEYDKWVNGGKSDLKHFKLFAKGGRGKAQPLYSKIYTPDGFKTMGEIKAEDFVISENGLPVKVLKTFPQGIKDVYRIKFSDNTYVDCCDEHLWKVQSQNDRDKFYLKNKISKYQILTTKEIKDIIEKEFPTKRKRNSCFSIPVLSKPVEFTKKETTIPPYLLGLLIGDGGLTKGVKFSTLDLEIVKRIEALLLKFYPDLKIKKTKGSNCDYNILKEKVNNKINNLKNDILNLGLNKKSEFKFIPKQYLYSCKLDRIELLQGLMDTDGTVSDNGNAVTYCTTSEMLKNNFVELVQSLGCIATVYRKENDYLGAWIIRINQNNQFDLFKLKRKQEKVRPKTKYKTKRYIKTVEYLGKEEQKCIMVDSDTNLYLTDNYAVTHNTSVTKTFLHYIEAKSRMTGKVYTPTHKAGKVGARALFGKSAGYGTVASLMELMRSEKVFPKIIIFDEVSMIGSREYNKIIEYAKKQGSFIISMGDIHQLPPIKEQGNKVSQFFDKKDSIIFNLEEPMRFGKESGIFKITETVSNNLKELNSGIELYGDSNEGDVEIVGSSKELVEQFIRYFRQEENGGLTKLIAYGNNTVAMYNNQIRNILFGKEATVNSVVKGDVLMGRLNWGQNPLKVPVQNSQDYIVTQEPIRETVFQSLVYKKKSYEFNLDVYSTTIKETDEKFAIEKPISWVDISFEKNKPFAQFIFDLFENLNKLPYDERYNSIEMTTLFELEKRGLYVPNILIRANKTKKVYTIGEVIEEIKRGYNIKDNFEAYNKYEELVRDNKLTELDGNIAHGFAITTHNSQGSTYKTALVDEKNISHREKDRKVFNLDETFEGYEANHMRYVAFSRPTDKLIIYTQKPVGTSLILKDEIVENIQENTGSPFAPVTLAEVSNFDELLQELSPSERLLITRLKKDNILSVKC